MQHCAFAYVRHLFRALLLCFPILGVAQSNKPVVSITQSPTVLPTLVEPTPLPYAAGTTVSYVRAWEAKEPIADAATLTTQSYAAHQTTTYVDGLGRPLQTVVKAITPGIQPKDLVSTMMYDEFGRESLKYMPYVAPTSDGGFKIDPFNDQKTFFSIETPGEQILYSKTEFDASPLNRPVKGFPQGNSWTRENKFTEQQYLVNTAANQVQIWNVGYDENNFVNNVPFISPLPYEAGELYQNKTIDENGSAVVEFKDKGGKVLLKKVQETASATEAHSGWLCTYYVYDDLDRLRFVISPKAAVWLEANNWSFSGTEGTQVANELCFRYEYDYRARMIAKKVPGAGWTYLVYDKRDRLIFSQDANLRVTKKWMATLYDELNRPVLTGIITYNASGTDQGIRAALQSEVESNSGLNPSAISVSITTPADVSTDIIVNTVQSNTKEYNASYSILMAPGFYSDQSSNILLRIKQPTPVTPPLHNITVDDNPLPASYNFIALTITHYDNYAFNTNSSIAYTVPSSPLDAGSGPYPVVTPTMPTVAEQGLFSSIGMVTGTSVRTLPDPNNLSAGVWLNSVQFYDNKGRVLQTYSDNYKGGIDKLTNLYNFAGNLLCSRLEHFNPQNPETALRQITVQTNMDYDHAGRLEKVTKSINGETAKIIASNTFDPLGQLSSKELGKKADDTPLETLDYNYNVRGWLKGINKDYAITSGDNTHWFGMELNYDWGFDKNQYNGNIAGTKWRSKGDGVQRSYGFGYDRVNRFVFADFAQGAGYADDANVNFDSYMGTFTDGNFDEGTAYDANGNIKRMQQWGLQLNSSTQIDDLKYTYSFNGSIQSNKLLNVIDANNLEATKLGDFRTGANHPQKIIKGSTTTDPLTITDYEYDASGNLIKDLNKDIDISSGVIQGIQYNHLNLPWKINVKNKGTITYIYDAAGNKLEKKTDDITTLPPGGINGTKITSYVSGFVYENNVLQFLGHEEGRVRVVPPITSPDNNTFAFDYFIKDHLGNVRMVLTDEIKQDNYPAVTLEDGAVSTENTYYNIVGGSGTIVNRPSSLSSSSQDYQNNNGVLNNNPASNATATSQKMYQLNGTGGGKTGLGVTLKVMSGDVINIFGKSYYEQQNEGDNSSNNIVPLNILTGFLNMGTGSSLFGTHSGLQPSELDGVSSINSNISDFLTSDRTPPTSNKPRAYINYIIFDEQFNYVAGGASPVDVDAYKVKDHHTDLQNIPIPKNGYIYVYCSNESPVNVLFDNLQVIHDRGPLLEETHYYPFGLIMNGISLKAEGKRENIKQYNSYELNSDLGINLNESFYRLHDPQLGRFLRHDPKPLDNESLYGAMGNNPIKYNDLLGDVYHLNGSKEDIDTYLKYLNSTTGNIYKVNKHGDLVRTNKKLNTKTTDKISGTLSKEIERAIKSTETVSFNLINNDAQDRGTSFDSYGSGNVDMRDLAKIKDNPFLAGTIGHFLDESMQQPDITKRDTKSSEGLAQLKNFHKNALEKEGQIVTEMYGVPNHARVESQGVRKVFTSGSLKGTETFEYIYDYGQIQYQIRVGVTESKERGYSSVKSSNGIIYSVSKIK